MAVMLAENFEVYVKQYRRVTAQGQGYVHSAVCRRLACFQQTAANELVAIKIMPRIELSSCPKERRENRTTARRMVLTKVMDVLQTTCPETQWEIQGDCVGARLDVEPSPDFYRRMSALFEHRTSWIFWTEWVLDPTTSSPNFVGVSWFSCQQDHVERLGSSSISTPHDTIHCARLKASIPTYGSLVGAAARSVASALEALPQHQQGCPGAEELFPCLPVELQAAVRFWQHAPGEKN